MVTLRVVIAGTSQRGLVSFGHLVGIVSSADPQIVARLQSNPGAEVDVDDLMQPKDVVEFAGHNNRAMPPGQGDAKYLKGRSPGLHGEAAFIAKGNHHVTGDDWLATLLNGGNRIAIHQAVYSQAAQLGIKVSESIQLFILPGEVLIAIRIADVAYDGVAVPYLVAGAG